MSTLPPAITQLLRRHPALFVTVAYLAVSLTGLAFSWAFFRRFDVNYFLFADLTDFLLAAAREPLSLAAAAGGLFFVWLVYAYGRWEYRRLDARVDKGRLLRAYLRFTGVQLRSGGFAAGIMVLYVFSAVTLYGGWRAATLRDGQGTLVEARIGDAEPVALLLMGSSARFVFLYDPANGRTVIVPDESLASLTVPRRGADDSAAEPEPERRAESAAAPEPGA